MVCLTYSYTEYRILIVQNGRRVLETRLNNGPLSNRTNLYQELLETYRIGAYTCIGFFYRQVFVNFKMRFKFN